LAKILKLAINAVNLSYNAENKVQIAREGGISPLIALVRDGTPEAKVEAAGALLNLALNAENKVQIAREGLEILGRIFPRSESNDKVKNKMNNLLVFLDILG